jgi:hypothetical protein
MIKKLTILSLFLLVLPFFQTCSDKNLIENSFLRNSTLTEEVQPTEFETKSGEILVESKNMEEFHYTFQELKEKKQKTIRQFLLQKKEITNNGYELGLLFIIQLDAKDLKNTINFGLLPFFLTIIIAILAVIFSFLKKWKIIIILTSLNLFLLIAHLIIAYKSKFLEDIEQIKFGYYLFIINLVLIVIETYKVQKKEKDNLQQLLF